MGPLVAVAVRDRGETLVHCEFVALLHSKQVGVVFVALAESLTATAEVAGERFSTRTQRYVTQKFSRASRGMEVASQPLLTTF